MVDQAGSIDVTSCLKPSLFLPPKPKNSVGHSPPEIDKVKTMLASAAAKIRACLEERHASLAPTPEELKDLSLACGRLWCVIMCCFGSGM